MVRRHLIQAVTGLLYYMKDQGLDDLNREGPAAQWCAEMIHAYRGGIISPWQKRKLSWEGTCSERRSTIPPAE